MSMQPLSGEAAAVIVERMLSEILGGQPSTEVIITGDGALPSVFSVTELATASVAAAGVAVSELLAAADGHDRLVTVDRRLASMWFASSLRPQGWEPPPPWDVIAGDYRAADGWIRLHTNAAAHREAALAVLGAPADRDRVSSAVAGWKADDLESAVVAAGGCAATMHSLEQWQSSPPGRSVAAEPLIQWEETGDARAARPLRLDPARPLAGVRVLDLTRVLAGPVATRFLALLGADVLRIDPPWWEEPGVVPDVMLGKRSARLDLHEPENRDRILALLAEADVLVHGYRPGALDSLDLGHAVRLNAAPGAIEVSLDAYGWTGPWAGRRGFDSLVQMSAGIADAGMRGFGRDNPTPLPVQALDHAAGYLMAHAAIRALATRHTTGRGSRALLSLARTAHLLTSQGTAQPGSPFRAEDERDVAPAVEHTSWGPARRLLPPLSIDGVDIRADLPARSLGSDSANW
ncbi:MAG: CoA transferase [Microbacteriaceae bacterium]